MKRDRAAYMRDYRARKRGVKIVDFGTTEGRIAASFDIIQADLRIAELEEEVARLKLELAARPSTGGTYVKTVVGGHAFSSRPFTPAPKK